MVAMYGKISCNRKGLICGDGTLVVYERSWVCLEVDFIDVYCRVVFSSCPSRCPFELGGGSKEKMSTFNIK